VGLKLWNVDSGTEIRTFSGHSDSVLSFAFSPDGHYALSGSRQEDNTLKLWDVASGADIRTFRGHYDSVWSVAFSPDGRHALSGSYDGTLKLWEVVTSINDKSLTWQVVRSRFADEFIGMLLSGGNFLEAFQAAEDMIINKPDLFSGQRPWLDDDGDGQFLNDGLKSEQIFVGRQKIDSAAPPPEIQ